MIESTIDTRQPRFWGTSSEQAPYRLRTPRLEDRFPSLEEILASQDELPALSLILGLGEDGVPLVVDLEDPEGSAFLIASDDGFDNTALLHNLITAALKGNHPEELFVHLISPHADDLTYFHHQPHFRLSYQPFHPGTPIVIEEMVKLVISRQQTPVPGTGHILAIDGLDLLWQALDPQAKLNLDWLIRNGPAVGLWVIATVESTYLPQNLTGTIDMFPSRILGPIQQANLARFLSGFILNQVSDLTPGEEFLLITGGHPIHLQTLFSEELADQQTMNEIIFSGGRK